MKVDSRERYLKIRWVLIYVLTWSPLRKKKEKIKGGFETLFQIRLSLPDSISFFYFCSEVVFSSLLISNFDLISLMK
jgi:hypothetical protein